MESDTKAIFVKKFDNYYFLIAENAEADLLKQIKKKPLNAYEDNNFVAEKKIPPLFQSDREDHRPHRPKKTRDK
jgi:hypothetical protein